MVVQNNAEVSAVPAEPVADRACGVAVRAVQPVPRDDLRRLDVAPQIRRDGTHDPHRHLLDGLLPLRALAGLEIPVALHEQGPAVDVLRLRRFDLGHRPRLPSGTCRSPSGSSPRRTSPACSSISHSFHPPLRAVPRLLYHHVFR